MIELLTAYTVPTILIITFMVAVAVKEVITLIDFFVKKAKGHFDANREVEISRKEILETVDKVSEKIDKIVNEQEAIKTKIDEQQDFLDLLMESDKDQLKSLIVNRYHHFIAKGWIDDFSMDSLEKCFQHYKDEGGNSYVHDLMDELRRLPHSQQ